MNIEEKGLLTVEERADLAEDLEQMLADMTRDRDEWRQQHQNAMACWKTDMTNVVESANFQAMAKLCDELEDNAREFEVVCNQRDEATDHLAKAKRDLYELRLALADAADAMGHTHVAYCQEAWTSRGLHAPECMKLEADACLEALSVYGAAP